MGKPSLYRKLQSAKGVAWLVIFITLVASYMIYYAFSISQEKKIDQKAEIIVTQWKPPAGTVTIEKSPSIMPSSTGKAEIIPPVRVISLPPQGLYESCLPKDASCMERLAEMGSKGFKIVLNDGLRYAETAETIIAYADAAKDLGMKVILPVKYSSKWDEDSAFLVKKFPELAREGNCKNNEEFLVYYLKTVKDHPALWGYYIADEVHLEYYQGLKLYADIVKRTDPTHPRLIVEEGTNDPMELFFTLPSLMGDVADVLGVDNYPYGFIDTNKALTRFTGDSARLTQLWSEKLGIKSAMVLQAYAQPQYYNMTNPLCLPWPACAPFPGYEQMKAQRDQVILNSEPEMILWFSYPDILSWDIDNWRENWDNLVAAAFSPLPTPSTITATPVPQDCPSGWSCEDIGFPKRQGMQSLTNGVWKIEGAGTDIWSDYMKDADQFRYVFQNRPDVNQVSARLISQVSTNSSAKAGIMLRKTFDPISPYYAVLAKPGAGVLIQYRSDFGQDPLRTRLISRKLPVYLRIVRNKDVFSAYVSDNAETWMLLPGSRIQLPGLDGFQMVGLAVSSGNEVSTSAVEFDQVRILSSEE